MLELWSSEHHRWVFLLSQEQQITSHFQHAVPHPKKAASLHRDETPNQNMGPGGKVDYRVSKILLWRFREPTFSRTCSTVKIAKTRTVEPIHPLLNKKMLTSLGGTPPCAIADLGLWSRRLDWKQPLSPSVQIFGVKQTKLVNSRIYILINVV